MNVMEEQIFVFKTSIKTERDRQNICSLLNATEGVADWNVDLDDCDRVLRVVTATLDVVSIIELINQKGYLCIELD